ncbi:MAG: threonylcarbamoyl-AMP synthase [Acidobacteriia bacterium 12-62-4]|nr:MAG: threonylcarbamoyl-AMP synthase [Acidobacteriia bacterium 12-62-4]
MPTDLLEVDQTDPDEGVIASAAAAILRGKVVAIPTDGLYSLVADPFNLQAVGRVFAAKGREQARSLPLLVSDVPMAEELCAEISARFRVLARVFWPGPLTAIVPASPKVPLRATGNTGRLGLRHSRSKVAQALLQKLNQPLIATSANISGQPTCTSGIEVFGTMDGRLDLVLDGGTCPGMGPTTIDITEPYWRVIKEGAVPEKELAEVLRQT